MNRHNKKILSSMDNNIDLFNKYKHHYFDFIDYKNNKEIRIHGLDYKYEDITNDLIDQIKNDFKMIQEIQATYPETRFYKQALHISNKHSNNMKKQLENKVINRDNEYQFLRNIATQLKCPLMLNNFNYGGIYICYKKEVITSWI